MLAGVALGGVFSVVTATLHSGFGALSAGASLALLALVGPAWPLVRRRARWLATMYVSVALFLPFLFLCAGLGAAAASTALPVALLTGIVTVAAAGARLRADLPRREAAWDAQKAYIEREVVDLTTATYHPGVPLDLGVVTIGSAGPRGTLVRNSSDAAAVAGRVAPVVAVAATLGAVASGHGFGDLRVVAIAILAPLLAVWLSALLAPALILYRSLVRYERQIGRPLQVG